MKLSFCLYTYILKKTKKNKKNETKKNTQTYTYMLARYMQMMCKTFIMNEKYIHLGN